MLHLREPLKRFRDSCEQGSKASDSERISPPVSMSSTARAKDQLQSDITPTMLSSLDGRLQARALTSFIYINWTIASKLVNSCHGAVSAERACNFSEIHQTMDFRWEALKREPNSQ